MEYKLIKLKLYTYQVCELISMINFCISFYNEQLSKPENKCIESFLQIQLSMAERIKEILNNKLQEQKK